MIEINDFPNAKKVFDFFFEISKIPRGSGNTEGITAYLVDFAKSRGLEVVKDSYNNVIIKKNATEGYENRPTVIIQGHTDLVAEKTPECPLDMNKDSLELYRDGDFIRAKGTSLGGDDGVAVAYALAILDSSDIPHPPIEALFTSDEEIGLIGATGLDASNLNGKLLINVDSDIEGTFTVGCAGGIRVDAELSLTEEKCDKTFYNLTVGGLLGGHSGMEIDKNRANAIKILAEVLSDIPDIRLVSLNGGSADNAIPRDAIAIFAADGDIESRVNVKRYEITKKWCSNEKDLKITLTPIESRENALTHVSTAKILSLINDEPTGVIAMSRDIEGLVETSLNMGIASTKNGSFTLSFSIRSSKNDEKRNLKNKVAEIAKKLNAIVSEHGDYPAWEYRKDSALRDAMCLVYEKMYNKAPEVIVIHAGLECGIFADKIEGLDCVSIGPDNFDIHTPEEHLSISSTARVYEFILELLKNIA